MIAKRIPLHFCHSQEASTRLFVVEGRQRSEAGREDDIEERKLNLLSHTLRLHLLEKEHELCAAVHVGAQRAVIGHLGRAHIAALRLQVAPYW